MQSNLNEQKPRSEDYSTGAWTGNGENHSELLTEPLQKKRNTAFRAIVK